MAESELSLLENAMDYISDATERLNAEELKPVDLKYIILHLFGGICLLLKQLLAEEHWSLIFNDINSASKVKLKHGNFVSVNFDSTCKRLKEIREFNIERNDLKYLHKLRKYRNQIEHYSVNVSKTQVIPIIFECCNFALEVIKKFEIHLKNEIQGDYNRIESNVSTLNEFVKSRNKRISGKIKSLEKEDITILPCPICMQTALPLTGQETSCLFCHEKLSPNELLEAWESLNLTDSIEDTSWDTNCFLCDTCGENAVVSLDNKFDWICLFCAIKYKDFEIKPCSHCGQEFLNQVEVITPCPYCKDAHEKLPYSQFEEENSE